jgi:hypothetical protein
MEKHVPKVPRVPKLKTVTFNCLIQMNGTQKMVLDTAVPPGWMKVIEKGGEVGDVVRFHEEQTGNVFSTPAELDNYFQSKGLPCPSFNFSPNFHLPLPPSLAALPQHTPPNDAILALPAASQELIL